MIFRGISSKCKSSLTLRVFLIFASAHVCTRYTTTTERRHHCVPCNVYIECPREMRRHQNTRRHRYNVGYNVKHESARVLFPCPKCDRLYAREDNLLRHQKKHCAHSNHQHLPVRLRQDTATSPERHDGVQKSAMNDDEEIELSLTDSNATVFDCAFRWLDCSFFPKI